MAELKKYDITTDSGYPTTILLSREDAKARGLLGKDTESVAQQKAEADAKAADDAAEKEAADKAAADAAAKEAADKAAADAAAKEAADKEAAEKAAQVPQNKQARPAGNK